MTVTSLRAYSPWDQEAVAGLEDRVYGQLGHPELALTRDEVAVAVATRGACTLVAVDDDGHLCGWVHYGLRHHGCFEIARVAVDTHCRRRGTGRQLVAAVTALTRRSPDRRVGVLVPEELLPGTPVFFARCGFRDARVVRLRRGEDTLPPTPGTPGGVNTYVAMTYRAPAPRTLMRKLFRQEDE